MGNYPCGTNRFVILASSLQCHAYLSEETLRTEHLPEDPVGLLATRKGFIPIMGQEISDVYALHVTAGVNIGLGT
jgi:hypothetical protein